MSVERYDDKDSFMDAIKAMRPDLMFPEHWDAAEKAKAVEHLGRTRLKTGMLSSIPMRCAGPKCPIAASCPLLKENLAPLGERCPIELAMSLQFFQDYVEELAIDTNSMIESSLVSELVDQEIQYMRKKNILAQEHFIQENPVGIDSDGNVILRKELHQAVEYEDRILRRKDKIRAALMATREQQAKLGQGIQDNARAVATLMDQFRQMKREEDRLLLKKLGREHYDDYIEEDDIADAEVVADEDE